MKGQLGMRQNLAVSRLEGTWSASVAMRSRHGCMTT